MTDSLRANGEGKDPEIELFVKVSCSVNWTLVWLSDHLGFYLMIKL